MAEWLTFGTTAYGSLNGQPYERIYGFPEGGQFALSYRIGSETNLAAHVGKVLRAVDAEGAFNQMWVDVSPVVTVYAAVGATKSPIATSVTLQYERSFPMNNKWRINVPDTTIPLGLFRAGAGKVNTNQWAGIGTSSFISLVPAADAAGQRPHIARIRYLMSPKPRWIGNAPADLVQGDTTKTVDMYVAYTDGTPVVGLRLRVTSTERKLVFGLDGTQYVVSVFTDSNGRVSVPVRNLLGGSDAVLVTVDDMRCEADYFDPPLSAVFPINAQATTVGGRDCVVLPARPEIPYKPAVTTESMSLAWNAGAYSQLELEGDCEIVITNQQAVVGAVLGFVSNTDDVTNFKRMTHGFYFTSSAGGRLRYQIMESGRAIGSAYNYAAEVLRVQRIGSVVRYMAGAAVVYTSRVPLTGPLRVGCSLFATGDSV